MYNDARHYGGITLHSLDFQRATHIYYNNLTKHKLDRKSKLTWNPRWSPIQLLSTLEVA